MRFIIVSTLSNQAYPFLDHFLTITFIFFPGLEIVKKEDLDLANHLVGLKQTYIKMSFLNMTDLQKARKDLLSAVRKNKERLKNASAYQEMLADAMSSNFEGKCD